MPSDIQEYKPDKQLIQYKPHFILCYFIKTILFISCAIYQFHLKYFTMNKKKDGELKTLKFEMDCENFVQISCEKEVDVSFAYTMYIKIFVFNSDTEIHL